MAHQTDTARLSRLGTIWRLAATLAALAALAVGQVHDTNDLFPLGSLSQYATPRDMDGTVSSTYLVADLADGETAVHIPLNPAVVGVGRAEVEGQVGRIQDDPSLLGSLGEAYAKLNPGKPALRHLYLQRSTSQLEGGIAVGDPTIERLAEWEMP